MILFKDCNWDIVLMYALWSIPVALMIALLMCGGNRTAEDWENPDFSDEYANRMKVSGRREE